MVTGDTGTQGTLRQRLWDIHHSRPPVDTGADDSQVSLLLEGSLLSLKALVKARGSQISVCMRINCRPC